jgi:hypothetical protein
MNETTQGLTVVISLKDQLSNAMGGVQKRLSDAFNSIQKSATAAFIIVKAGFLMMAREALKSADQIDKMSKQTGISIKNIQKLGLAAQASGASMGQITQALKMLSRDAYAASRGNEEAIRKFEELGIAIYDVNGNLKSGEILLENFSDVIAGTASPTERMALATKALGRSGAELIPMLEQGSAGIKRFGDNAERFGFLMSEETVAALDKFGDQMETVKTIFVNMVGTWMHQSGITVPKIIDAFLGFSKFLDTWIRIIGSGFRQLGALAKFAWRELTIWFDAMVESGKIAFAKLAGTVEPFVGAITDLLVMLDLMTEEKADKIRNTMINMGAEAGKKSVFDPFVAGAKRAEQALVEFDDESQQILQNTRDGIKTATNDIDTFGEQLKSAIGENTRFDPKTNVQNGGGNTQARRNIAEMEKDIRGGLILAIEDLSRVTMNFRERWGEMFSTMKDGFSDAVARMITEGKSLRESMKVLFKDIKYQFFRMITDMVMNQVFKQFAMTIGSIIPGFNIGGGGGGAPGAPGATGRTGVAMSAPGAGAGTGPSLGAPAIQMAAPAGGMAGAWGLGAGANPYLGAGVAVGGAVGGYVMNRGVQSGNMTQGVAGGALMGAAMGAVFGPVGMVVGALAGAAMGYFGASEAKEEEEKMKERQRAAEEEARRRHEEMVEKAKGLIKMHIRNNMSGGLATEEAMKDISGLFSGDISAEEVEKFGAENVVARQGEIERASTVDVGGVSIQVSANVSGQYDVQRLAEDLGYHLSRSIRSAAAGATS